ncbi:hypothetical protein [Candidatus Contendibacter odensensis]|uniref:Uncharacterized protein n=1 Tax=Candidatus Contendobacter odensis Run_B_J11 TaxID=1400861 RepID=A0A7U7GG21_9GAMM|nr:hypothetical protein [Candidatus Contendobacter odensis]CDH47741.1 hypothetical protein BN874_920007 [Candidatus Contendobacter odensis Run_B_J11]
MNRYKIEFSPKKKGSLGWEMEEDALDEQEAIRKAARFLIGCGEQESHYKTPIVRPLEAAQ